MASSAKGTYFATPEGGNFTYVFLIRNTSSAPFDIYGALIAAQYGVPILPGGLQNITPISSPPGWQLVPSTPLYGFLTGGTNWAGTAASSGYVMPGDVGTFVFQSSTAPPNTLPFGCCFYNGNNEWGFCYDGTAERVDCVPTSEFPRPWVRLDPISELRSQQHSSQGGSMLGTTSRTIGGDDGAPFVNLTYDRFGNIIKMSPNPSKLLPSRST
jgi:hypothetical protein